MSRLRQRVACWLDRRASLDWADPWPQKIACLFLGHVPMHAYGTHDPECDECAWCRKPLPGAFPCRWLTHGERC